MEPKFALRDLVETERELSGLMIERAERLPRRQSRPLRDQIDRLWQHIDHDIKRLERAWLHGS